VFRAFIKDIAVQRGLSGADRAGRPTSVGEALAGFLKASGLANNLGAAALRDVWRQTVGGEICSHTRVVGVRKNVLIVEVDSAPWLSELAGFYKQSILGEVQRKLPAERIRDIQFRTGSF
jgi:predicted nucleic acid-binding Zn ribbon protein